MRLLNLSFAPMIAIAMIISFALSLPAAANVTESNNERATQIDQPRSAIATELEKLLRSKRSLPDTPKALTYAPKERVDELRTGLLVFYQNRDFAPLWLDAGKITKRGRELLREIRRADEYGLDPERILMPVNKPDSVSEEAELDARMSFAAALYADHAAGGRIDPRRLSGFIDRGPQLVSATDILSRLARATDPAAILRDLHPKHEQFKRLRDKLREARNAPEAKAPPQVSAGKTLYKGKTDPRVLELRARLEVEATEDEDPERFGDALEKAVKDYQRANGLKVDGLVGRGTIARLNKKPESPVARILVNMERWRWMPEELGDYHVWNNVPEQITRTRLDGKVIFEERIVVGKYRNQTPLFSDQMEHLVFAPFWNVPDSIKVNEILPKLYSSPGALARQGLEVKYRGRRIDPYSVNWSTVDIRRYHVYQPPGARNALGRVKFMFPNKHHVYMHDTPSKSLFNRNTRAFSHGCVRVRNPLSFAQMLLNRDKGWGEKRVANLFWGKTNTLVKLDKPIPVHITYLTAVVDENGDMATYGDVYQHDKRMTAALNDQYVAPIVQPKPNYTAQRRKRLRELEERRRRQPRNVFEALFGYNN